LKEGTPAKGYLSSSRRRRFNKGLAEVLKETSGERSLGIGAKGQLRDFYDQNRHIQKPHRIVKCSHMLKLPAVIDDYYLNVLDWSSANILACGLGVHYYLWNATNQEGTVLAPSKNQKFLTALKWIDECHLAVGNADKEVQIWDMSTMKQLRKFESLNGRVTTLAVCKDLLVEGGSDNRVLLHDLRLKNHHVATLRGHIKAVCGLAFSSDGWYVASGGTDNKSLIWDTRRSPSSSSSQCLCCTGGSVLDPMYVNEQHTAAVKALSWCGSSNSILATGGGSADRCIKLFNIKTGKLVDSINSGSQICSLLWAPKSKEIISAHGFSHNRLCTWQYPEMKLSSAFEGHTSRVLYAVLSPDCNTVASVAADQTLRFWEIWTDHLPTGHTLSPLKYAWQNDLR